MFSRGSPTVPVHLRLLPSHPGAQLHLKLPAVLVQAAWRSQLWAPISHSLISDTERRAGRDCEMVRSDHTASHQTRPGQNRLEQARIDQTHQTRPSQTKPSQAGGLSKCWLNEQFLKEQPPSIVDQTAIQPQPHKHSCR